MVVVGGSAVCCEVLLGRSCVVDVGEEVGANLVSVFEEDVDSIVVAHKLRDPTRERVCFSLELVHPVVFINNIVLKGLSSP